MGNNNQYYEILELEPVKAVSQPLKIVSLLVQAKRSISDTRNYY